MLQIPCSLNSYTSGGLQVSIGLCNESHYGESVGHPSVRSGEHIGISRVTNKRMQPRKVSAVFHHLLYHKVYPRLKFLVSCVTRIRSTLYNWKKASLWWEIDQQWIVTDVPPLSVWMSFCRAVSCALWLFVISFLVMLVTF